MKWLLKLKRPGAEVERWKEILETVEERVYREGEERYLQFPELESVEEARAAYDYASSYLHRLNRALKHVSRETDQLEAAGLFHVAKDGKKHGHAFGTTAVARATAHAGTAVSTNREERIQKRKRFVELAMNDKTVDQILQLRELDLTPTNMYNILEGIVTYDLGGRSSGEKQKKPFEKGAKKVEELGWFKKKEIKDLKWGLQPKETAGKGARHYFWPIEAPELTLRQMREMTSDLIQKWLAYKESEFWKRKTAKRSDSFGQPR